MQVLGTRPRVLAMQALATARTTRTPRTARKIRTTIMVVALLIGSGVSLVPASRYSERFMVTRGLLHE